MASQEKMRYLLFHRIRDTTASIATRALNFGLYCFRVVVIDPPSLNDSAES